MLSVLIPTFFLLGFIWGVRFQTDKKEASKPILKKAKPNEQTKKQKQMAIEARNVDNYFSPWSKQEDIK